MFICQNFSCKRKLRELTNSHFFEVRSMTILVFCKRIGVDSFIQLRDISVTVLNLRKSFSGT